MLRLGIVRGAASMNGAGEGSNSPYSEKKKKYVESLWQLSRLMLFCNENFDRSRWFQTIARGLLKLLGVLYFGGGRGL